MADVRYALFTDISRKIKIQSMHNFQTNAGYSMKNKGTKYCILDEKTCKKYNTF